MLTNLDELFAELVAAFGPDPTDAQRRAFLARREVIRRAALQA